MSKARRGPVFQRGASWTYVAEVGLDPKTGKRKQVMKGGFKTKREAEREWRDVMSQVDKDSFVPPSNMTMREFLLDRWLPGLDVKASTRESYRINVETHIVPNLGGRKLQRLAPEDLNTFYRALLDGGRKVKRKGQTPSGLSPKTVRNIHVVIRKALGDAQRWGYVARNVATLADAPKVRSRAHKQMKTWTDAQLRSFLDHVRGDLFYCAWLVASMTGMRRGEVLGLRWEDVDLDAARLSVRRGLVTIGYRVEFSTPKNGQSRTIDLDAQTVAALRAFRAEAKLAAGPAWDEAGLVFTMPDGSAIHPERFSQLFDLHVRRSGLPRIRLHDLRHTHASILLKAGVPVKVVSERLGHASVAFTMDVYSHVLPGMQADAAERFAALVLGESVSKA